MADHDIYFDRAGFGNLRRLTCLDCNDTIIKQPYMTGEDWVNTIREFANEHPNKNRSELTDNITDYELVSWAVRNGWTYIHVNDQLRDPQGGLTTANNWERIGWRRNQIIVQAFGE